VVLKRGFTVLVKAEEKIYFINVVFENQLLFDSTDIYTQDLLI